MAQEFDDAFVQQMVSLWINPEIERRKMTNLLPEGFTYYAAQVIMNHDAPTQVRFNEEVHALVKGKYEGPSTRGDKIDLDQFEDIKEIDLTEADANAGHITILAHRGQWIIRFDFRYNAARSRQHLAAAREFIDAAASSLERGHLRPLADNLFSAVELLAKATLLLHDHDMLITKKHGMVQAKYNLWGKLGNTDSRYTKLLNRLADLRSSSRYLNKELNLTPNEATDMLIIAENMFIDVDSIVPKRG